jgi:hypothetical protein
LDFDLISFYESIRTNEPATLRKVQTIVEIERAKSAYNDFQTWCQEVVWWGNKKGAYLYTNKSSEKQLAGHF